jgi:hypothetical protein
MNSAICLCGAHSVRRKSPVRQAGTLNAAAVAAMRKKAMVTGVAPADNAIFTIGPLMDTPTTPNRTSQTALFVIAIYSLV